MRAGDASVVDFALTYHEEEEELPEGEEDETSEGSAEEPGEVKNDAEGSDE